jgi:hypothetical protein
MDKGKIITTFMQIENTNIHKNMLKTPSKGCPQITPVKLIQPIYSFAQQRLNE